MFNVSVFCFSTLYFSFYYIVLCRTINETLSFVCDLDALFQFGESKGGEKLEALALKLAL